MFPPEPRFMVQMASSGYYCFSSKASMRRSDGLRCCFVLQIRNGKITSLHTYYNMMTLMEQLGLVPAWGQETE